MRFTARDLKYFSARFMATRSLGHANRGVTEKSYLDPRFASDRSRDLLPDLDLDS